MESPNEADERIIGEFYCEDTKRNVCMAFEETDQTVDIYLKIFKKCSNKTQSLNSQTGCQRNIQEIQRCTKTYSKKSNSSDKCLFCPFKDKSPDSLHRHMLNRHLADNKSGTLICTTCNCETKTVIEHRKHLKSHLEDKKLTYFCTVCPYNSHKKYVVIRHFKDHAKPHEEFKGIVRCPVCSITTKHISQHAKHHIGTRLPNNQSYKFVNKKWEKEQVEDDGEKSDQEKTSD